MKIEEKGDKLVIVDFNEFEAYRISCKIEQDGMEFYEEIASGLNDPHVSEILRFMLEEERKHLRFFDGLLNELRRDKEDIGEDDDLLTSMDFGIFEPYQGLKKPGGMIEDAPKALGLGIAVEEGSIKFYQACKENVSSEDTRQELENIIAEEKKHKALFETMLKTFKK